jgi:hypothetical protein
MPENVGFLNYFAEAQSALPMGVNVESMSLVFTIDNGLEDFLPCSSFIVFLK